MRRAYARWFLDDGERSRDEYALRHPSQYVPILNAVQMGNGWVDSDLFGQVRDAIDGLFQVLGKEGQDYMRALKAIVGRHAPYGDEPVEGYDAEIDVLRRARKRVGAKAFRRVQARWAEAARGAVLLNAPVLRKHFDSGWDAVSAIVEDGWGIRHGVLEYLDDLLLDVEASQAGFLMNGFLDLHSGPSAAAVRDAGRPRLLVRPWSPELRGVLAATRIDELWRALRGRGRGFVSRDATPAQTDHTTLLVAACVAFRVGQWGSAAHFCNRAGDILKGALFRISDGDCEVLLRE